jgi:glycosyltransferase involved in cell wall biosynthesis
MALELQVMDTAGAASSAPAAPKATPLNLLAYVHLRNIHGSTGAGRVARQVVEHLGRRDGVNLRILADAADKDRIVPLVREPWSGYRYHTFAKDTSRQQAEWVVLNRPAAEEFWPQADVVFCTGESFVPVKRARLVVTAHDAGYFDDGAHRRDARYWKQRLKWALLFRKLSRHVDMFHTVSRFSAERLAHAFPEIASRIRWVHNGVTPHFFAPPSAPGLSFLANHGLNGRPYILVPGGLHFRKNAELILAASRVLLQRLPDLVIAVVNHSDPSYLPQTAALGPNFKLLGFVSDEALHALYSFALLVWYPSRYEGFGLPVVEAMACGAPVVASNSSSIPEIAGDAAILVDPSQPAFHVDAIESLMTDARARTQLGDAGRLRAAQFTWPGTAEKLQRLFSALV